MGNILVDTLVRSVGNKTFEIDVSDEWSHYFGILGGYVIAHVARCAMQEAAAGLRARSIRAFYASAPHSGPARVSTQTVHHGRTLSYVRALLVQGGRLVMELNATFTTEDPLAPSPQPPSGPKAELDFDHASPAHSKTDSLWVRSLEGRMAASAPEALRQRLAGSEWIRFRETDGFTDHPQLATELCALIVADLLGYMAISQTLSNGWIAPTVDISTFLHGRIDHGGLFLCESSMRGAATGAAFVESSVWSPNGTLIATAVQTMLYRQIAPS